MAWRSVVLLCVSSRQIYIYTAVHAGSIFLPSGHLRNRPIHRDPAVWRDLREPETRLGRVSYRYTTRLTTTRAARSTGAPAQLTERFILMLGQQPSETGRVPCVMPPVGSVSPRFALETFSLRTKDLLRQESLAIA